MARLTLALNASIYHHALQPPINDHLFVTLY